MRVAPSREAVLYGEVLSHTKNSLELRVIESWRGGERRDIVRVWGDNGEQCRPYVSKYPVGTTWVLALTAATPEFARGLVSFSEHPEKKSRHSDYVISVCGEHAVQVYAGSAMGVFRGRSPQGRRSGMSLGRLRTKVNRWP